MRTQSFGYFLDMIKRVIGDKVIAGARIPPSYHHLDLAQAILVRWGCSVPWSWATWDDRRTANAECITDLVNLMTTFKIPVLNHQQTTVWLYHLNSPFFSLEGLPGFKVQLQVFLANKASSSAAMLVILSCIA